METEQRMAVSQTGMSPCRGCGTVQVNMDREQSSSYENFVNAGTMQYVGGHGYYGRLVDWT